MEEDKENFIKEQMEALVACETDLMDFSAQLAEKYGTQVMVTCMTKVVMMVLIMIRQHDMGKDLAQSLQEQLVKLSENNNVKESDIEAQIKKDFVDVFKGGE